MILTYLDQLKQIAIDTGWPLDEACEDSGIAPSTLYRWRKGTSHPNEKTSKKIADYMQAYRRPEASSQDDE